MLAEPKLKIFQEIIHNATKEELIWLSGYLSAVIHSTIPVSVPNGTLTENIDIIRNDAATPGSIINSGNDTASRHDRSASDNIILPENNIAPGNNNIIPNNNTSSDNSPSANNNAHPSSIIPGGNTTSGNNAISGGNTASIDNPASGDNTISGSNTTSGNLADIAFNKDLPGNGNTAVSAQSEDEKTAIKTVAPHKITIVYGTETGNSKKLATDFAAKAKKNGLQVKLAGLDQYRLTDLPKEEYLFTVISTQGDGEPPIAAKKFYDHIHNNGFQLNRLKYSVLALGDTSYPLFCKTGEEVDAQLKQLGGERLVPLQKCDTDYETEAHVWFDQVLTSLQQTAVNTVNKTGLSVAATTISVTTVPVTANSNTAAPSTARPVIASSNITAAATSPVTAAPATVTPVKKATGKVIYKGLVLNNINLNDRGSHKETRHIEITAENVEYEPGDSLGIVPENSLKMVEEILKITGINPDKKIQYKEEQTSLFDLLKNRLNISYLHERVVKRYAAIVGQDIPEMKIDLPDLLKIYPVKDITQFEEVLGILNLQSPRLYTISSSPSAHTGEVHITVAKDEFVINAEKKYGVCSDFLCQVAVNDELNFFIQKNKRFRLPADETTDIIMIGPGTGIAPFRSFVAERDATGATGKNWLFFGDQHFVTDFLYQTEWQNWLSTGVLTKIDLAFSRDQKEKVYVQHKIKQQAKELTAWIDNGAHLYLCGAKDPMSVDVEQTLIGIIGEQKSLSYDQATEFLNELKESGRYHKDVY